VKHGVVWLDQILDKAHVNPAAAHLLGLPPGEVPACDFVVAMKRLAARALNRAEIPTMSSPLSNDMSEDVDVTFCFAAAPTRVHVSSYAARQGAFSGSVWAVEDVSELPEALAASEAAQALLLASADGMLDPQMLLRAVRDPDGRVVDFVIRGVNRASCSFMQEREEDLVGRSAIAVLPSQESPGLMGRIAECLEDGKPVILDEFRYFNHVAEDFRRYDIRAARAGVDLIVFTWRDVTERYTSTQRIAASEQHYRMLAENAGDVVTHFREGRVLWASPSVEAVLGAPPEYWLGRSVLEFVPAEDVSINLVRLARLAEGGTVAERLRVIGADGVMHWVNLHAKPFFDAEGRPDGEAVTLRLADDEVAAEQAVEEARRRQAKADERYRRVMDNAAVGMGVLTPEGRLEEVNDALCQFFGYDAETLKQKTWQELTAPDDLEADLKNVDEVLEGRTDSYRMIKQYIHADGHPIWGDLSVSCIRDEHGHVENLISQVTDVTLVERRLRERLEFEEFMSRAIDDGRLVAYSQPIVDAHTGQMVEEELLVRIIDADGQVMVPGEFLPQAHRFGMMGSIDRFMVARGIELARAGRRVAVNLSADSINDAATIAAIAGELRRAGEAAARVSFEITETTALASGEVAERFSSDMRSLGCRLALDDFGTGFGSFTELRGMTLHKLKIDRSFVSDMLSNNQDESVVKAIVGIATEFGLLTTAEGVEDTETRTRLVELGVDQLQGYLIGAPTPATTNSFATSATLHGG